jgi:hypothetical protein
MHGSYSFIGLDTDSPARRAREKTRSGCMVFEMMRELGFDEKTKLLILLLYEKR